MSPFIINRIPCECIFILNNELLTKKCFWRFRIGKRIFVFQILKILNTLLMSLLMKVNRFDLLEKEMLQNIVVISEFIVHYLLRLGCLENQDDNLGDTKYYQIMKYGECNHDSGLLKKRKHSVTSEGIEYSPFPLLFHSNFIISFVFKFLKT